MPARRPVRRPVRRVGIDLGGTAIKAGALIEVGEGGEGGAAPEIADRRSVPLPRGEDPDAILDALAELARELGFPEHTDRPRALRPPCNDNAYLVVLLVQATHNVFGDLAGTASRLQD